MDLTPKQQASEAIRQSETILITTGQRPSIDQVTAVLALATILRKFGKKVSAVISDPLPPQVNFLDTSSLDKSLSGVRDFILRVSVAKTEAASLRYETEDSKLNIHITPTRGNFAPSDVTFDYGDAHYDSFDLAIVLGVPSAGRIDRVYADNQALFSQIPLINIDFHRSNEGYGAVNLIEGNASSLNEIIVATSESLQTGLIDEHIATIMLTGLMASTDRFTATHTTSKSLTVAAQMMAAGAHQQEVVRGLFRDGRSDRNDRPDRGNRPQSDNRPAPQPAPKPAERPAEPRIQEPAPAVEPIIEPGHMELDYVADEPVEHDEPTVGDSVPMADFAAAAEILAEHPVVPQNDQS